MRITDDVKRFSEMCYCVGVMSGNLNEEWADDMADDVVTYITQLFRHAKDIENPTDDDVDELVNNLKDEINRLKEEYQEEHIRRVKAESELKVTREQCHKLRMDKDFSHNPHSNIYGG